jgi:hypothetical protein
MSALVRWLPNIVEATADDVARFGPNAARVRALLDFLPTMSDEANAAAVVSAENLVKSGKWAPARQQMADAAQGNLRQKYQTAAEEKAWSLPIFSGPEAGEAAGAEALSDILPREAYQIITDPINSGRAVDILRTRPRLQDTPFLDVVRDMGERGAIAGPRDVAIGSRLARSPEDILKTALLLMGEGMSAQDAMVAARLL